LVAIAPPDLGGEVKVDRNPHGNKIFSDYKLITGD
jgi:hypothetical protein